MTPRTTLSTTLALLLSGGMVANAVAKTSASSDYTTTSAFMNSGQIEAYMIALDETERMPVALECRTAKGRLVARVVSVPQDDSTYWYWAYGDHFLQQRDRLTREGYRLIQHVTVTTISHGEQTCGVWHRP
ncbi:MAG: hypothetical protein AAF764_10685 [Pseudomonadota bacterium]